MLNQRRAPALLTTLMLGMAAVIISASLPWGVARVTGEEPDIQRLGGPDRYATAASISRHLYPSGASVAYIASGENFPDALSAASAAGRTAPVLLSRSNQLPGTTAAELTRLRPQLIVVVGGGGVISERVVTQLRRYATTGRVVRYAGQDRYATAAGVSRILFADGARTVYLATGLAAADAISGAPAAAADAGPLLLVTRTSMPAETAAELARLDPARIILIGGPGVIGERVADQAARYAETVRQWGGANRYETSAVVSERTAGRGGWAVVANAYSYADGITGAAAAAYLDGPILLTAPTALSTPVADELRRIRPEHVIVVGGEGAVAQSVVRQIADIMKEADPEPPTDSPPPSSNPTATPTSAPTGTPDPGPSVTPRPTAAPTATPAPTAPPPPPPTTSGPVLGYGARTVGGAGGRLIEVRSIGELKSALAASGPRQVRLVGSGTWDAQGAQLSVTDPYLTLDGSGSSVVIVDGWIAVRASEVILRNLRIRTGDDSVDAADADAISINGGTGGIHSVVVDRVEAIWGPDVGGITILNSVTDVTVQNSIIGEGLYRSAHPESGDGDGHSYAMNITGQSAGAWPRRVTVVGNLITTSESRNPRVCGAEQVDLVNNVIYNYSLGPSCNPRSLNMVNNLLRSGPAPAAAGLKVRTEIFTPQTSGDYPSMFSGSVYLSGNVTDGFTGTISSSGLFSGSLRGGLSVAPESVGGLLDRVLTTVGPRPVDATTQRLLNNARNRTGGFVNG